MALEIFLYPVEDNNIVILRDPSSIVVAEVVASTPKGRPRSHDLAIVQRYVSLHREDDEILAILSTIK